jgi:hypothetical protein
MWDDARRTMGSGDDLLRQAYLLTGDPTRAERLAQRALAAAAQHARRTGPAGADEVARAELVRVLIAEPGPGRHGGEPLPPGQHAAAWIALGGLPARRRAVLVLRYGEGLSDEQISARLGSSSRTVQADAEAALLTLGPALTGATEPARLVAAALADAGRRWDAGGYRPAAGAPAAPVPAPRRAQAWERPVPAAERSGSWSPLATSTGTESDDGHDWWSSTSAADGTAPALPRRQPGVGPMPGTPGPGAIPSAGSPPTGWSRGPGGFAATGPDTTDHALGASGWDRRDGGGTAAGRGDGWSGDGWSGDGWSGDGWSAGDRDRADSSRESSREADRSTGDRSDRDGADSGRDGDRPDRGLGADGQSERWDGADWPSDGWDGRGFGAPAPAPSAGSYAASGHDRPGPATDHPDEPSFAAATFPLDERAPRHRLRTPTIIGAAALTTLVLGAAVILVPAALSNDGGDPEAPPAAAATSNAVQVPAVPTRSVPRGLLDWPARGPLGNDEQVLDAATAAWKAKAPAAEAPTTAVSMLYAGELDGRHVALLQALDKSGKPRVAQLSGYAPTAYRLVHAEPLMGMAELLAFLPKDGRGGRLRVLVSPEGQAADGLLASDVSKVPLAKVHVNGDGVSDILPSPPGIPTCSRVVLMGLPAPLGRTGPRVLESGVVSADMLEAMMMEVEVGSSTLASGDDAMPQTVWFTDGAMLAQKARLGKAMVTVAALGPRLSGRPLSGTDKRTLESRAYELRSGGKKFVGAIVTFGGRTICTTVSQVAPAQEGRLTAFALRCPVPSGSAGLVHVVGGADVQSVQVQLDPTRDPPGQAPYATSVSRPESGATSGFAVLDVVQSGFPCGPGTVQATGTADASKPIRLPVFTP